MTVSSKVRLYDLAKELKQDTKRLIEEVRREGVDVSVPSNSISKELADKIRSKYFPKKEAVVHRGVRVVKRAARPVEEQHETSEEAQIPETNIETAAETATPDVVRNSAATKAAPVVDSQTSVRPMRLIKKLTPSAKAETPAEARTEEVETQSQAASHASEAAELPIAAEAYEPQVHAPEEPQVDV